MAASLGHGLDERPAVRDRCPLAPQLEDLLPQDGQTGWGWPVSQLLLHPRPEILYGIEIWRVTRPIHDGHVLERQALLDGLRLMTRRAVLEEASDLGVRHGRHELLFQNGQVTVLVHRVPSVQEGQLSPSSPAEAAPDHLLLGKLDCLHRELWVKLLEPRGRRTWANLPACHSSNNDSSLNMTFFHMWGDQCW